ncbi:hypothetical protein ElyMa_005935700 [Elysia marginata]|uniref:Immunoglobulin domain-containing protein n=1 Tax=Elysia marginata TaxID=1093978 RepID=A0AAV4G9M4_9GAST|nr:hypothetical protein ElyMa_005935700 [Elysia marginata]
MTRVLKDAAYKFGRFHGSVTFHQVRYKVFLLLLVLILLTQAIPTLSSPPRLVAHQRITGYHHIVKRSKEFFAKPVVKYVLTGENLTLFCNVSSSTSDNNIYSNINGNNSISINSHHINGNNSINNSSSNKNKNNNNNRSHAFKTKINQTSGLHQNIFWILPNGKTVIPNKAEEIKLKDVEGPTEEDENLLKPTTRSKLSSGWTITNAKMADTGRYICKSESESSRYLAIYDVRVVAPPPAPYQCHVVQKEKGPAQSRDLIVVCSSPYIDPAHFKFILVAQALPLRISRNSTERRNPASHRLILAEAHQPRFQLNQRSLPAETMASLQTSTADDDDVISGGSGSFSSTSGVARNGGNTPAEVYARLSVCSVHDVLISAQTCSKEFKVDIGTKTCSTLLVRFEGSDPWEKNICLATSLLDSTAQQPEDGAYSSSDSNEGPDVVVLVMLVLAGVAAVAAVVVVLLLVWKGRGRGCHSAEDNDESVSISLNEPPSGLPSGVINLAGPSRDSTAEDAGRGDSVERLSHGRMDKPEQLYSHQREPQTSEDLASYMEMTFKPVQSNMGEYKPVDSRRFSNEVKLDSKERTKKDSTTNTTINNNNNTQCISTPKKLEAKERNTAFKPYPLQVEPDYLSPHREQAGTQGKSGPHCPKSSSLSQSLFSSNRRPSCESRTSIKHETTPELDALTERSKLLQRYSSNTDKTKALSGAYSDNTDKNTPSSRIGESSFTRNRWRWSLAPRDINHHSRKNIYPDSNDRRLENQRSLSVSTVDDEDWLRKWVWLESSPDVTCAHEQTLTKTSPASPIPFIDDIIPPSETNTPPIAHERNAKINIVPSFNKSIESHFKPIQNDDENLENRREKEKQEILECKPLSKRDYYKFPNSRPKFNEESNQGEMKNESTCDTRNEGLEPRNQRYDIPSRLSSAHNKNITEGLPRGNNGNRYPARHWNRNVKAKPDLNVTDRPNATRIENNDGKEEEKETPKTRDDCNQLAQHAKQPPPRPDIHVCSKDFRYTRPGLSNHASSSLQFLPQHRSQTPTSGSAMFSASSSGDLRLKSSMIDDVSWESMGHALTIVPLDLDVPPKLRKKTKSQSEFTKTLTTKNVSGGAHHDYDFPKRLVQEKPSYGEKEMNKDKEEARHESFDGDYVKMEIKRGQTKEIGSIDSKYSPSTQLHSTSNIFDTKVEPKPMPRTLLCKATERNKYPLANSESKANEENTITQVKPSDAIASPRQNRGETKYPKLPTKPKAYDDETKHTSENNEIKTPKFTSEVEKPYQDYGEIVTPTLSSFQAPLTPSSNNVKSDERGVNKSEKGASQQVEDKHEKSLQEPHQILYSKTNERPYFTKASGTRTDTSLNSLLRKEPRDRFSNDKSSSHEDKNNNQVSPRVVNHPEILSKENALKPSSTAEEKTTFKDSEDTRKDQDLDMVPRRRERKKFSYPERPNRTLDSMESPAEIDTKRFSTTEEVNRRSSPRETLLNEEPQMHSSPEGLVTEPRGMLQEVKQGKRYDKPLHSREASPEEEQVRYPSSRRREKRPPTSKRSLPEERRRKNSSGGRGKTEERSRVSSRDKELSEDEFSDNNSRNNSRRRSRSRTTSPKEELRKYTSTGRNKITPSTAETFSDEEKREDEFSNKRDTPIQSSGETSPEVEPMHYSSRKRGRRTPRSKRTFPEKEGREFRSGGRDKRMPQSRRRSPEEENFLENEPRNYYSRNRSSEIRRSSKTNPEEERRHHRSTGKNDIMSHSRAIFPDEEPGHSNYNKRDDRMPRRRKTFSDERPRVSNSSDIDERTPHSRKTLPDEERRDYISNEREIFPDEESRKVYSRNRPSRTPRSKQPNPKEEGGKHHPVEKDTRMQREGCPLGESSHYPSRDKSNRTLHSGENFPEEDKMREFTPHDKRLNDELKNRSSVDIIDAVSHSPETFIDEEPRKYSHRERTKRRPRQRKFHTEEEPKAPSNSSRDTNRVSQPRNKSPAEEPKCYLSNYRTSSKPRSSKNFQAEEPTSLSSVDKNNRMPVRTDFPTEERQSNNSSVNDSNKMPHDRAEFLDVDPKKFPSTEQINPTDMLSREKPDDHLSHDKLDKSTSSLEAFPEANPRNYYVSEGINRTPCLKGTSPKEDLNHHSSNEGNNERRSSNDVHPEKVPIGYSSSDVPQRKPRSSKMLREPNSPELQIPQEDNTSKKCSEDKSDQIAPEHISILEAPLTDYNRPGSAFKKYSKPLGGQDTQNKTDPRNENGKNPLYANMGRENDKRKEHDPEEAQGYPTVQGKDTPVINEVKTNSNVPSKSGLNQDKDISSTNSYPNPNTGNNSVPSTNSGTKANPERNLGQIRNKTRTEPFQPIASDNISCTSSPKGGELLENQSQPNPKTSDQPHQSQPDPKTWDQPHQSQPKPKTWDQPHQSQPKPYMPDQPHQSQPDSRTSDQPHQSHPNPKTSDQLQQSQPGPKTPDQPNQPQPDPRKSDQPHQSQPDSRTSDQPCDDEANLSPTMSQTTSMSPPKDDDAEQRNKESLGKDTPDLVRDKSDTSLVIPNHEDISGPTEHRPSFGESTEDGRARPLASESTKEHGNDLPNANTSKMPDSRDMYQECNLAGTQTPEKELAGEVKGEDTDDKISRDSFNNLQVADVKSDQTKTGSVFDSFPQNSKTIHAELHNNSHTEEKRREEKQREYLDRNENRSPFSRNAISEPQRTLEESNVDHNPSRQTNAPNRSSPNHESFERKDNRSAEKYPTDKDDDIVAIDSDHSTISEPSYSSLDPTQDISGDYPSTASLNEKSPHTPQTPPFRPIPRNAVGRYTIPIFGSPASSTGIGSTRKRDKRYDMFSRYWRKGELLRPRVRGDYCVGPEPEFYPSSHHSSRYSSNLELTSSPSGLNRAAATSGPSRGSLYNVSSSPIERRLKRKTGSSSSILSRTQSSTGIDRTDTSSQSQRPGVFTPSNLNKKMSASLALPQPREHSPGSSRRSRHSRSRTVSFVSDV